MLGKRKCGGWGQKNREEVKTEVREDRSILRGRWCPEASLVNQMYNRSMIMADVGRDVFWLTDGCALKLMMVSVCYQGSPLQWERRRGKERGQRGGGRRTERGAQMCWKGCSLGFGGVGGLQRMFFCRNAQGSVHMQCHSARSTEPKRTALHFPHAHKQICTYDYTSHTSRLTAQRWTHTQANTLQYVPFTHTGCTVHAYTRMHTHTNNKL